MGGLGGLDAGQRTGDTLGEDGDIVGGEVVAVVMEAADAEGGGQGGGGLALLLGYLRVESADTADDPIPLINVGFGRGQQGSDAVGAADAVGRVGMGAEALGAEHVGGIHAGGG